jgi:hypothetical protein
MNAAAVFPPEPESGTMRDSDPAPNASYRFRIFTNDCKVRESEALTFGEDPEEVWHDAAMSSCEMLRDLYGRVTPGLDWRMEVSDRDEKVLYRFSFKAEAL